VALSVAGATPRRSAGIRYDTHESNRDDIHFGHSDTVGIRRCRDHSGNRASVCFWECPAAEQDRRRDCRAPG